VFQGLKGSLRLPGTFLCTYCSHRPDQRCPPTQAICLTIVAQAAGCADFRCVGSVFLLVEWFAPRVSSTLHSNVTLANLGGSIWRSVGSVVFIFVTTQVSK
jgi:hypothetical protein